MALRKGRKGRKVPPTRLDLLMRTAAKLNKVTREEVKLRKETARAQRLKLKTANDAAAQKLREAEHARMRAKDKAHRSGDFFERIGAYSPDAAVARPADAYPPKPARTYIARTDSDGKITRTALPPVQPPGEKRATSEDYKKPERKLSPQAQAHLAIQGGGGAGGFCDPGGTVSRNIQNESGRATVRVTGPWPGGRR
jgi:hypothetical protein